MSEQRPDTEETSLQPVVTNDGTQQRVIQVFEKPAEIKMSGGMIRPLKDTGRQENGASESNKKPAN